MAEHFVEKKENETVKMKGENAKDDEYHSIKQNPWCEHENEHLEQIRL